MFLPADDMVVYIENPKESEEKKQIPRINKWVQQGHWI